MPDTPIPQLATCPDCGGILQPVRPERLTSFEVAHADDARESELNLQCLLCGYAVWAPASAPDGPTLQA